MSVKVQNRDNSGNANAIGSGKTLQNDTVLIENPFEILNQSDLDPSSGDVFVDSDSHWSLVHSKKRKFRASSGETVYEVSPNSDYKSLPLDDKLTVMYKK